MLVTPPAVPRLQGAEGAAVFPLNGSCLENSAPGICHNFTAGLPHSRRTGRQGAALSVAATGFLLRPLVSHFPLEARGRGTFEEQIVFTLIHTRVHCPMWLWMQRADFDRNELAESHRHGGGSRTFLNLLTLHAHRTTRIQRQRASEADVSEL